VSENDTTYILICEYNLLATYQEEIMQVFKSNCLRLGRDKVTINLLVSFMLNNPITLALDLLPLHRLLS